MNHKQSGFTIVEVLGVAVATVAFVSVATVGYMAIKHNNSDDSLKSQKSLDEQAIQRGKAYFEFPDLGMKFEKTNSNKGMSFASSKHADGVYLVYDEKLRRLAKECYGQNRNVSFGSVQRNEGYSSVSTSDSIATKQFDTFNITMRVSSDIQTCTDVTKQGQFSSRITDLQKQLRYSIQGAEKL